MLYSQIAWLGKYLSFRYSLLPRVAADTNITDWVVLFFRAIKESIIIRFSYIMKRNCCLFQYLFTVCHEQYPLKSSESNAARYIFLTPARVKIVGYFLYSFFKSKLRTPQPYYPSLL